jgi:hypothetical protein
VDLQLPQIPSLGTFTTGCLAGADLEVLGRKTNGSLHAEVLGFGAIDELSAHLLDGLDIFAGEGDADLVDFLQRTTISNTLLSQRFSQSAEEKYRILGHRRSPCRHLFGILTYLQFIGFAGHDARVLVT